MRVPVYIDEAETRKVAARVSNRINQIEKTSDTIDTHMFALEAALSFATELAETDKDQKVESKEVLVALDALSSNLRALIRKHGEAGTKSD